MNTVFFGKEGITMTSANHLCNLAKERIEALKIIIPNALQETYEYLSKL